MTLTPEDIAAIRQAIRDETAAANKSAIARITGNTDRGNTPEDLDRRLRDLELEASLRTVRNGESAEFIELKDRVRKLEARVLELEKPHS